MRQAASKAVSKQREILLGDGGSEDEEQEDQEESYMDRTSVCLRPLRLQHPETGRNSHQQWVYFCVSADESGSDEDFMVEDDDDSDYGQSKKRGKKVIRRGRPDKKERKSPKPRLKATGEWGAGSFAAIRGVFML